MCEHKYVHYDCKKTDKYVVTTGMTEWTRIDYFFCEKCLVGIGRSGIDERVG